MTTANHTLHCSHVQERLPGLLALPAPAPACDTPGAQRDGTRRRQRHDRTALQLSIAQTATHDISVDCGNAPVAVLEPVLLPAVARLVVRRVVTWVREHGRRRRQRQTKHALLDKDCQQREEATGGGFARSRGVGRAARATQRLGSERARGTTRLLLASQAARFDGM